MDKQTKAKDFGGITSGGHTPLTYNSYLMVDALKNLQVCQSSPAHHDEPLFIVIHQAYIVIRSEYTSPVIGILGLVTV